MKKKIHYIKILRNIIQLIFLILLPGLYANAFLGIKVLYQGLLNHNFSFAASLPVLISTISVIPLTLFLGRFFCGWMCAFGTLGDMMFFIGNKIFKFRFNINERVDSVLKHIKYLVFVLIFFIVWSLDNVNISAFSPWDAFGSLFNLPHLPDFSYVIKEITIGFVLLVLIMIASMFIERFFCRYLCPMGAVFAIVSNLKLIRIKKPSALCGKCKACTKHCPMGIPLYSTNRADSAECIDCMKCVTICPRDNVSVNVVTNPVNPAVVGALAVTAMSGVYFIGTYASDTSSSLIGATTTEQSITTANNSPYADGTYQGSGTGFRGATTTVSVTIKNGKINNIETVSYGDDAPYYNSAFQYVTNQIIDGQDANVDGVSGATFSSNGIMEAVSNALDQSKQSKGNSSVQSTLNPTKGVDAQPTIEKNKKSNDSTDEKDSSNIVERDNKGTTSDEGTPKTNTSDTNNSSMTVKYKDGTYKGSAYGFRHGITTVSVTIKNSEIKDVAIISNEDDAPFFNSARDNVIGAILDTQSAKVDAVSGATYSSNGIMNAVEDALSSAVINQD